MRIGTVIVLDLFVILLELNVFALFHHVLAAWFPPELQPLQLVEASAAPEPAVMPEVTKEESPTEEPSESVPAIRRSGRWGEKFADQFTDGEVIETDHSYRSANISVTVKTVEEEDLVYHVAEVYVSDLKYLRTATGHDGFGHSEDGLSLAQRHGALAAISGDHYYGRLEGVMIRNGLLYREDRFGDLCVLQQDGTMLTYPDEDLDLEALKASAPWQVWSFGPRLMENGHARTDIPSELNRLNPRSAIGYVEPGHYFFVQVDGRGGFGSAGMNLDQLAQLFESLGCTAAYNLDGGRTATMIWKDELVSYPYGRPLYDIIYVTDHPEEENP